MTTTAPVGGDGGEDRAPVAWAQRREWVAHNMWAFAIGVFVLVNLADAMGLLPYLAHPVWPSLAHPDWKWVLLPHPHRPVSVGMWYIVSIIGSPLGIAMVYYVSMFHPHTFCDHCVTRRVTLNGSQEAVTHRRALRAEHLVSDMLTVGARGSGAWRVLWLVARCLVVMVAALYVVGCVVDYLLPEGYGALVKSMDALAVWGAFLWLEHIHRLLQPWCPQCNPGGGDDLLEPSPDPVIHEPLSA
jgi:hypothetical protein